MSRLLRKAIMQSLTTGVDLSSLFATTLYTGNGATQDVVSDLDYTTREGLVWCRLRDAPRLHGLYDTVRGTDSVLSSNSTVAEIGTFGAGITSFNVDGFSIGTSGLVNQAAGLQVAWQFMEQEGFFDIIKYTGDGIAGREIPHGLGVQAGLCIVKRLDDLASWRCQHIGRGGTNALTLDTSSTEATSNLYWNDVTMTDSAITLGSFSETNGNGNEYIMYVFAHDPSSVIQCGEFDASGGNVFVNLSWSESIQYILVKPYDAVGNWEVFDTVRGITKELSPNLTDAELTVNRVVATTGGFTWVPSEAKNYVYMAIREF